VGWRSPRIGCRPLSGVDPSKQPRTGPALSRECERLTAMEVEVLSQARSIALDAVNL